MLLRYDQRHLQRIIEAEQHNLILSLPAAVPLFRSPVEPLGLLLVLLGVAARHRRPARPLAPAALPPAIAAVSPPEKGKLG